MKDRERRTMEAKVMEIFNPFGGYTYDVPWVADMITQKIFEYTSEKIEMLEIPLDFRITAVGTETVKHLNAKYTAYILLCKLGAMNIEFESIHWSDVFSPSLNIRVECGHTDPSRLIKSFLVDIKEFWILQYPRSHFPTMLYKFTLPNKERLNRYQELRSKIELDRLIDAMKKPEKWI